MSGNFEPNPRTDPAIQQTAADWVCGREMGLSQEQLREFELWLAADPRHAEAFAQAERMSRILAGLPAYREEIDERLQAAPPARVLPFPFRRKLPWAVAAAVAAVVALSFWRPIVLAPGSDGQRVVANASAPRTVLLADGSRLALNRSADLRVRLTAQERRIELAAGEAHFEVQPDRTRPFVVQAGGVSVRAVGTAFNVVLGRTGVEVVVTEGRVEVTPNRPDVERAEAAPVRPLVEAGERVWVPAGAGTIPMVEKVAEEQMREKLAWRHAFERFTDVPLGELLRHFNRVNSTQIMVEDPRLAERRMGGTFALSHVDAFVRLLESEGDVIAQRRADGTIMLEPVR